MKCKGCGKEYETSGLLIPRIYSDEMMNFCSEDCFLDWCEELENIDIYPVKLEADKGEKHG